MLQEDELTTLRRRLDTVERRLVFTADIAIAAVAAVIVGAVAYTVDRYTQIPSWGGAIIAAVLAGSIVVALRTYFFRT